MLKSKLIRRLILSGALCTCICLSGISGCSEKDDNIKQVTKEDSSAGKIDPNKARNGKNGNSSDKEETEESVIDIFSDRETELLLNTDALNPDKEEANSGDIKEVVEVERGDYSHSLNAMAERYFLDKYYETVKIPDIKFIKYKVEEGDYVKKGDTIFTYETEIDEIALQQMEADVVQKEKDYTAGYDSRKAEIKKAEHELKALKKSDEIKLKKLEIKKLKQALTEYTNTKSDLKQLKEELVEYKAGANSTKLTAGHEGYILSLAELEKGNYLSKGYNVAVISPKKEYYIQVDDISEGRLRYNSEVTVSVDGSAGEEGKSMKGIVISASNILSPDNQNKYAYVKIKDEPEGVNWDNPIKIAYTSKELKDVLMIPREALQIEENGEGRDIVKSYFVYIYENDHAYKRYVDVYDDGGDRVVILQGLNEGQKVVIYE